MVLPLALPQQYINPFVVANQSNAWILSASGNMDNFLLFKTLQILAYLQTECDVYAFYATNEICKQNTS